jgi:hypothetical protein
MTTELRFLAATVILALLHLILDPHLISFQLGYRWTATSSEQPMPPLRGLRKPRGPSLPELYGNFPFLRCGRVGGLFRRSPRRADFWGTQFYFWGRVGHWQPQLA